MPQLPFDRATFKWGQPGIPGTGITTGEKNTINSRLDALEALPVPPDDIGDLGDVVITSATLGDVITYDGTNWVNDPPNTSTVVFGIPFVLDGGGSTITTGIKYTGFEIPFACTVTGWTITSSSSGSIVVTVSKASYANHPSSYSAISGSEKPTLSSATKNQDLTLTTWASSGAISAGDLLQISVDSATTVQLVTVNLRCTRAI